MSSTRDVILLSILMFTIGFAVFITFFTSRTIVEAMVAIPQINNSQPAREAFQAMNTASNRFDYLMFGVYIAVTLAIIIIGFFVGGNPIFMFLYFLVVVIGVVLSAVLSNTWYDITTQAVFGTTISNLPILNHLMLNLPIYSAITGVIGLLSMFAKPFIMKTL